MAGVSLCLLVHVLEAEETNDNSGLCILISIGPHINCIIQGPILFVQFAQRLSARPSHPKEWPSVDAANHVLIGQLASLKIPSDRFRAAETRLRASRMAHAVRDEQS